MSSESFNLGQSTIEGEAEGAGALAKNILSFDFEDLEPV